MASSATQRASRDRGREGEVCEWAALHTIAPPFSPSRTTGAPASWVTRSPDTFAQLQTFDLGGFCTGSALCCAYVVCADVRGCSPQSTPLTLLTEYTAPDSGACADNNVAVRLNLGEARSFGATCINVVSNNLAVDFTLTNGVFRETLSIFTAMGDNCNVGSFNFEAPLPIPGFTPAAVVAIRQSSPQFYVQTRCTAEPCCAIVYCHQSNAGFCGGLRYSVTFLRPTVSAALAAGIIAAIAISSLVRRCARTPWA